MPSVCCYLLIAPIVFLGELKEVKDEEGNWMLFYYHFMRKTMKYSIQLLSCFFFCVCFNCNIFYFFFWFLWLEILEDGPEEEGTR